MAWSWSHTNEAYEDARYNLGRLPRKTLKVIYAEWEAFEPSNEEEGREFDSSSSSQLNEKKYKKALTESRKIPNDCLADYIWERASELATCDNGGFNAWMCPFGCRCHEVSFDRKGK